MYSLCTLFERRFARLQGKGYGSSSIRREIAAIDRLRGSKDPTLCIDIGGNVGHYTAELLAKYSDSKVITFEPSAKNVAFLRSRFAHEKRLIVEPLALSDTTGEATLFADVEGSGLASLTKRDLAHKNNSFDYAESIQTIRFDDYWRNNLDSAEIDILKMDVEGHEMDVLSGCEDAIYNTRVVQFEFGGCNIDTRTYFRDFWQYFAQREFDIFRITPFGVMKLKRYKERDEHFTTTNFLAVTKNR